MSPDGFVTGLNGAAVLPQGTELLVGAIVVGIVVVVGGIVATVELLVVGAEVGGSVVVGAEVGGGCVVGVVVAGGGEVVATGGEVVATVPGERVVTTGGWVVADPPAEGMVAGVVVVDSPPRDVELDVELDGGSVTRVVVGRTVVTGALVATCRFGDVSPPVATSKSRAARATEASAYRPTLKR